MGDIADHITQMYEEGDMLDENYIDPEDQYDPGEELTELTGIFVAKRPKAFILNLESGGNSRDVWIPFSKVANKEELILSVGEEITVEIPEWLYLKKLEEVENV